MSKAVAMAAEKAEYEAKVRAAFDEAKAARDVLEKHFPEKPDLCVRSHID